MSVTVPNVEDHKFATAVTLTVIQCGECGGSYAICENYRNQKHTHGGYWTCPYCKASWGYGKSALSRMEAKLASEQRTSEHLRDLKRSEEREKERQARRARAFKGHLKRTKARIAAGVCPCCNRHFQNLHKHMKGQHPGYGGVRKGGD